MGQFVTHSTTNSKSTDIIALVSRLPMQYDEYNKFISNTVNQYAMGCVTGEGHMAKGSTHFKANRK